MIQIIRKNLIKAFRVEKYIWTQRSESKPKKIKLYQIRTKIGKISEWIQNFGIWKMDLYLNILVIFKSYILKISNTLKNTWNYPKYVKDS